MLDFSSSRPRSVAATGALLLIGLTGCGGGTVATVTVTDTATVTASAPAASGTAGSGATTGTTGTPTTTRPTTSAAAGTSAGVSSAAAGSPAPEASRPAPGSAVPTSAAQETILTVRLQAYDPATGTLTFVPQDVVDTEGNSSAVLSDPVGAGALTAQVTPQTSVKFDRHGTDVAAAIAANDVYCNMVLEGNQVTWLWELYVT